MYQWSCFFGWIVEKEKVMQTSEALESVTMKETKDTEWFHVANLLSDEFLATSPLSRKA